jgi:esterase/lipase
MDRYFDINQQTYDWCVRIFDQVRKVLGVQIKMHHTHRQIDRGDIFLFNHFARVETFIPQYLIYHETGEFCRSIAAAEFFKGNDRFANALRELGVVPNDHPHLMELLATDILKGRKIVVFPEGGMVKDRQVVDDRGRYSVYSRHADERRKHHTGAARLAIGLQIFKLAVLFRERIGDRSRLESWSKELRLSGADELLDAARRPVVLVPASITFYPLRISDNILRRGAEILPGELSKRTIDELVVEGNILLKATDMDINLGANLRVDEQSKWFERRLAGFLARDLPDLNSIFDIEYLAARLLRRTATRAVRVAINRLRDRYMRDIYQTATVNLSHLASSILLACVDNGRRKIPEQFFREALYLAVKQLQKHREIRLHRGLCDPGRYQPVLEAAPSALTQFLVSAETTALIERHDDQLVLKEKLMEEHHFDEIRLENPIEVYANEVEPLKPVGAAVRAALDRADKISRREFAYEFYDDELRSLEWDRGIYSERNHFEINSRETATADPSPFFFVPDNPKRLGILLVHGFLASPAEVRSFGEELYGLGYLTLGVRLKGHGTSPWDLRDRSWTDWLHSVERGREIIEAFVDEYVVIGFSTGGSLGLVTAVDRSKSIAGVVAISPPVRFRNKNMRFVPLMHGANRVVRWLSSYEGVMPFRPNESEHPLINYRHMPLRGLYELKRLTGHLSSILSKISVPVCVIQALNDRVVDPQSASIIHEKTSSPLNELHWIESDRHGILNEDIGGTRQLVIDFLGRLDQGEDRA